MNWLFTTIAKQSLRVKEKSDEQQQEVRQIALEEHFAIPETIGGRHDELYAIEKHNQGAMR